MEALRKVFVKTSILSFCLISSCSFGEKIGKHSVDYNKSVETAHNAQILLNILRARDRRPMHFTAISQVRGRFTLSTSGNVAIRIPFGGNAPAEFPLTPSFTISESTSPSFDIGVLNSQEFVRGILSPVEWSTFKFYWDQGWPRELLIYLFFHRVERGSERYINSPTQRKPSAISSPGPFEKFVEWVKRVRDDPKSRLIIGTKRSGTPIGPPIDFSKPEAIDALVKIAESQQGLLLIPSPKATQLRQLCKVSKTDIVCEGSCPQADIPKQCTVENLDKNETEQEATQLATADKIDLGKVYLRSVQNILFYLGEVLREGGVQVRVGPRNKRDFVPLFKLTIDPRKAASSGARINYGGVEYFVPSDANQPGLTWTVLALLNQLLGLHQKRDELPTTRAVESVGG